MILFAKAPIWFLVGCSLLRQKLLKLSLADCEIPIPRDSAVRTGRNETRFVLPELKYQSRLSSRGAGGTEQKLCRGNYPQFFRKPNIRLDYLQGMNGSIGEIINEAAAALTAGQIDQPRREAVSLLMHTLNVDRAFVIAHPERELGSDELERFREFVRRRAGREPLQYITGVQEFFDLTFEVSPDVLIPRPETELIVAAVLDLFQADPNPVIAEVGTGSGCIAISVLHQKPRARAVCIDISAKALAVARRNAERHGQLDRMTLVNADGLTGFLVQPKFSAVISNPPYIPASEIESLQPEVRDYEPLSALIAGDDGLSHIRALLRDAPPVLWPGGYLIFEIGFGQRDAVNSLVDASIWDLIEIRNDLQSIPRTFVLRRK